MFRCSAKDNQLNAILIQGSYSYGGSNDIAGMRFQNYDNDSKIIYDMAEITMKDGSSNRFFDGYGDLCFKTKAGISNSMTEAMRINYSQHIGIGSSNPVEKLTVSDGNILTIGNSNGLSVRDYSSNEIGLYVYNSNRGLFYNHNFDIGKIISGNLQNPETIRKDISIDDYGNMQIANNLSILGDVVFDGKVTIGKDIFATIKISNLNTCTALDVYQQNGDKDLAAFHNASNIALIINNSGYVGINTNQATRELDINGDVLVRKNLSINSNISVIGISDLANVKVASLNASGIVSLSNNLYVLGNTSLANAYITNLISTGTSILANTNVSNFAASGNTLLANTNVTSLYASGAVGLSNNLVVAGFSTLANTNVSNLTATGTSTLAGTTVSSLNSSGAVGFSNNLVVAGTSTLAGTTVSSLIASGPIGLYNNLVVAGTSGH